MPKTMFSLVCKHVTADVAVIVVVAVVVNVEHVSLTGRSDIWSDPDQNLHSTFDQVPLCMQDTQVVVVAVVPELKTVSPSPWERARANRGDVKTRTKVSHPLEPGSPSPKIESNDPFHSVSHCNV